MALYHSKTGRHEIILFLHIIGVADGDIDLADRLLKPCLQQYPKGALFLFYAGRVQEIKGQIEEVTISNIYFISKSK